MKLIKLPVLLLVLLAFLSGLVSCQKNADKRISKEFSKSDIILNGAQEAPPNTINPVTATGTMNIFYTRETRILSYTVNWSGLTGPVTAMHIHGLAPVGFSVGVVQTFTTSTIIKCTSAGTTSCGSYSGTLLVDGVVVKETDLLNGFYYVNIHTAANPGGEIRGQIRFQ